MHVANAPLSRRNQPARNRSPAAAPWRVQFFRCGYSGAVSGWPGWRAVVTPLEPLAASETGAAAAAAAAGSSGSSGGGAGAMQPVEAARFWVDLPGPGAPSFLQDYRAAGAGADAVWAGQQVEAGQDAALAGHVGYNQAFEQVFQAHEQRLPREGVMELCARGAVEPVSRPSVE